MKILLAATLALSLALPRITTAQNLAKPEKQISFARENKGHAYYVRQAELWWAEVQKNDTVQSSWYNYYRACRSAQGTADWKEDFVKESPGALRLGADIVTLMKQRIPGTFVYHFVAGSTGGVSPNEGPDLMKAYEMKPDFEGIASPMVTLAQATGDMALRKEVNERWFKKNELSQGLIAYGYNLLMSVEPRGILLVQQDNDSYPAWMLQDALGIRPDVTVINIDFLLEKKYRERVFGELGIPAMKMASPSINDYATNWHDVVQHFLKEYHGPRPLHLSYTLSPELYREFPEKRLLTIGLTMKRADKWADTTRENLRLVENEFVYDYIRHPLFHDISRRSVEVQNVNYAPCFKIAYDLYKVKKQTAKARSIKNLFMEIAQASTSDDVMTGAKKMFN